MSPWLGVLTAWLIAAAAGFFLAMSMAGAAERGLIFLNENGDVQSLGHLSDDYIQGWCDGFLMEHRNIPHHSIIVQNGKGRMVKCK
jgi:hypothetical protein